MGLDTRTECRSHKNVFCEACGLIHKPKMAFVQWYKILHEEKLSVVKIDRTFGCIRLRWQRTKEEAEWLSSAAKNGLIPVASVKDFVHPVRRNLASNLLDDSRPRKQSSELL